MKPSPCSKKPEHLDIFISTGSHPATGVFSVVLVDNEGMPHAYPLLFMDKDDDNFSRVKSRISGSLIAGEIIPVGKLKKEWHPDFMHY